MQRTSAALGIVGAMLVTGIVIVVDETRVEADPSTGYIDGAPSTTPSTLGDLDLTELQYGDPIEGLGLIQPPAADADGGASLAYPLLVPPGRGGVAPDLALTYDSGGGSSWVGTGWDLSVGAVTVETEFGAPRYLLAQESETYALDGDRLFPNAIRTELETRAPGPRSDWVRQIEDDHDLITRHGSSPDQYCWEVADTNGNHRWYGGVPNDTGGCTRDESAILTAPATGAPGGGAGDFHWALTYVIDISGNTMRYTYDEVTGVEIGRGGANIGVSLYLNEITYTGFRWTDDAPDHPAYRVRFLRDGDVTDDTPRRDVNVDAAAGSPVVTADLLRRIEIDYLSEQFYTAGAAARLVGGWTLQYDQEGPFDKSLLLRIGQYGSAGPTSAHAWHEFTWFDDVTNPVTGAYEGFGPPEQWGNRSNTTIPNIAAESALGTSWRAGADGGAYVGFNPAIPSKIFSFGGSFNIAGGQTNEVSTLIDLDGDSLPDKVWVSSSGTVMYRPNLNRPGATETAKYGNSWFGEAQTINNIDSLGRSSDLKVTVHFEAYPIVAIQVGGSFAFSFGDRYFEDVNGDGRVDYIKPGAAGGHTVFFNVLNNGIPEFIDSSLATSLLNRLEVPLDPFVSTLANAAIPEVADLIVNTSPRIDTVRRWLAPHTGVIRVEGAPALTAGVAYRGDGAQVTVENDGAIAWSRELDRTTPSTSHSLELSVQAGEPVWFRLHVIDNAADDAVTWDPTVTYLDGPGGSPLVAAADANGRSQVVFDAADDFTLFGRTGARTALSEPGSLSVTVDVASLGPLSDDVEVVVLHGHGTATPTEHPIVNLARPALAASGSVDLTIIAPTINPGPDATTTEDDFDETDWIEVEVRSASPVDPTEFSIDISTTQPGVPAPSLAGIPAEADFDIPLDIPIVPNVRVFARTDHVAPYVPVVSPDMETERPATIEVALDGPAIAGYETTQSPAVVTLKTLDGGVVARGEFTVAQVFDASQLSNRQQGSLTLSSFTPASNTTYYLDVSVADPVLGASLDLDTSTITFNWERSAQDADGNPITVAESSTVAGSGQLHWPDIDGMFPSANRGWAYAGYNADHASSNGGNALVVSQFVFEATANGYDEDTVVPSASNAPSASEVRGGAATSFDPSFPYIPWAGPGSDIADRWRSGAKETLNGTGSTMQSDRLGADTALPGLAQVGRVAPQMLSITGDFHFMIGLVASFTAAAGGGRALKDFDDYNGDGFPDVRSGSSIEYTGPRGGLAATTNNGDNTFDTSLAVGGGLNGSAISLSSSGGSTKNNDGGGDGSNVEPTSTKSSRGMNIGLGFSVQSQWTNPLAGSEAFTAATNGDPDAPDIQADLANERAGGLPMDRTYNDMNGDGLPDRVDSYTSGELWVSLNLGYRFADAVQWSTGRTASNKDVGGSISVGFQFNAMEFAGGVAYNEGVGYSQFDWIDIDGDGVPDRMDNRAGGGPQTVFGSADGMERDDVSYGVFPNGSVTLDAARFAGNSIPLPDGQMEVSRSTGLSGGADFTFYIGPICLVACYIVINPGVHAGYDRQTSQVQMVDMNGDGWVDAVRSTDYEHVEVRLNKRGRTNMLRSVTNPLGGQIRLDYDRTGNTITNPESLWVMSSVEFDDGRAGDGSDVRRSEFEYAGAVWDPLLREQLGFDSVIEQQLADDGTTVLRSYESDFLNDNPFEAGMLVEERMYDGDSRAAGRLVRRTTFDWVFANADPQATDGFGNSLHGSLVGPLPAVGTTARLVLFDTALSPRLGSETVTQFDVEGDAQSMTTVYTYDAIGNVLSVHDQNESELTGDDTFTVITYSDCVASRGGSRTLGPDDSWVSVPQTVTVWAGPVPSGTVMKHRNGGPDLCGNSVPIRIAELVSPAGQNPCGVDLFAITEMNFDTHGSYASVAQPSSATPACADYPAETIASDDVTYDGCSTLSPEDDALRYCVDYVYDDHRFTDIAVATDNHGVSSSAGYDPLTGRLASRTDENGNLTTYTYDPQGRVRSITAPREQGSGNPTVTYTYGGLSATLNPGGAHAWATVSHYDAFNAGNVINTATFVDGMGRVVQRKRDAAVDGVTGEVRIVEGAIEYDVLGREVKEWYPIVERVIGTPINRYNVLNSTSGPALTFVDTTEPTVRGYDVFDRLVRQELPDGSVDTVAYDFEELPSDFYPGNYITMSRVRTTDPLGATSTRWLDVGGAVFRHEEGAAGVNAPDGAAGPLAAFPTGGVIADPRIRASVGSPATIPTQYDYDVLGRLIAIKDAAGALSGYTYDLQDNVTSTDSPDSGLLRRTFTPAGQMSTVERANGTIATYSYDRDRLMGVDYSDATPDVSYAYGNDGAPANAAGRVTLVVDGAMERRYGYDVDGNVASEAATEDDNPWGIGIDTDRRTWETEWEYDSLGRLAVLTYPDGEALTHDYDLGGRPSSLVAQAPQHDLYDQFGNAVARPDVEIVYVSAVRYDEFGEATYMRTGTGVETTYEFEPTRRFLAGIDTNSTAVGQFDGTTSIARPLQRLEYTYDSVGNVRDVLNRLYEAPGDNDITDLGPPAVNNVPGPSQHSYTYDGHYRLVGGAATYIDRQERRQYTYQSDYAANGSLLSKRQVTTTTSTVSSSPGGGGRGGSGNGKKGSGAGTGGTTTEATCESNTGSGGGSFNQDPETTYVIARGDLVYATGDDPAPGGGQASIHRLVRSGARTYTYDDNGNMTGWSEPCAGGTSTISRTMEWDAENRITRIAEGNNDTDYRYNAEGQRTLERGPGGTTWFVNEHWRTVNGGHRYANVFLGERMVASHRTSSPSAAPAPCTPTATTTCPCSSSGACVVTSIAACPVATRVFDPATSTCQPRESRTIHFLHADLQGSLRVATDEVGRVFQYVDYLPNGRPWVAGQSTIRDTPYLFAGGWTDTTYDLVNLGERWYEPREENFMSTEPLLEENPNAAIDDPTLLSAYTYAASNPLTFVDPDGRAPRRPYDVGVNSEKHASGHITISVAQREKRSKPALTFFGSSNDGAGQETANAFKEHADRAQQFTTILSVSTENGVRTFRVFGAKVKEQAVPKAGPGTTGKADDAGTTTAPSVVGSPSSPGDQTAPVGGQGAAAGGGTASGGGGSAVTPPPTAGGADAAAGGNDAPSPSPPSPKPPQPGAGGDAGPIGG